MALTNWSLGAGVMKTKFPLLVAVPAGVVTVIAPVIALFGTVAVIWVSELTMNEPATPPNLTEVAPSRFAPKIFTLVPGRPVCGVKLLITGAVVLTDQTRLMLPVAPL